MKILNLVRALAIAIMAVSTLPLISCSRTSGEIDNTPVDNFNLEKYLGKWYEIARFNHSFEKGLENVTAEYSLREDGLVKVLNSGFRNGEPQSAEGKAKAAKGSDGKAHLKVSFFLFFYADYKVLMTDDSYSFALVGSKTDKYLWILSRTPELPEETKDAILAEAERRGYDTGKLIWVDQRKNME